MNGMRSGDPDVDSYVCFQLSTYIFSTMLVTVFCALCTFLGITEGDDQLFHISIAFSCMSYFWNVLLFINFTIMNAVTSTVNIMEFWFDSFCHSCSLFSHTAFSRGNTLESLLIKLSMDRWMPMNSYWYVWASDAMKWPEFRQFNLSLPCIAGSVINANPKFIARNILCTVRHRLAIRILSNFYTSIHCFDWIDSMFFELQFQYISTVFTYLVILVQFQIFINTTQALAEPS